MSIEMRGAQSSATQKLTVKPGSLAVSWKLTHANTGFHGVEAVVDAAALRVEVAARFPLVPKPVGVALSFHTEGCLHCDFLRRDLEPFGLPVLPEQAIYEVIREMSCLSAQGWRWMLPSYLVVCLEDPGGRLDNAIEFLIYNLAPLPEHALETRERLSGLDSGQIACLIHFLDWCAAHEHWGGYCPDEIARGLAFLPTVVAP